MHLDGEVSLGDLRDLLNTREFWFFYSQITDEYELDEGIIRRYAAPDQDDEGYQHVVLAFGCPGGVSLELWVELEYYSANLMLADAGGGRPAELGWWDHARWHPFALQWLEVQHLIRYWQHHPAACRWGTNVALLLLAPFVGTGIDELSAVPSRRADLAVAYSSLGLFSSEEAERLSEATLRLPTEDEYRWTRDPALGWVFSGEYPCYSIRNPEHAGGEEGWFPFAAFGRVMRAIGLPD